MLTGAKALGIDNELAGLLVWLMPEDLNFFITTMPETRPADFYLGCLDGSVFIDFNNFDSHRLVLIRISFDGYGCCEPVKKLKPLSPEDSASLKAMFKAEKLSQDRVLEIIRQTVAENKKFFWPDALAEYGFT